jgi:hypothetical protein
MRIRRKFLQLTRETVPYKTESKVLKYLPKGFQKDKHGNYFLTIGENFTTMFTCHLDTACSYEKKVNFVQTEQFIKTDGTTILGADDKAGMTVILYMIEKKVPGLYYFFIGEERGCIGSSDAASDFGWPEIVKCVSFDRRGTTSVITEQIFGRCCSDEFAEALSLALNSTGLGLQLSPDDTGILTDSAQFTEFIPECTNISVGYYNEHTTNETQDIHYLSKLCRACTLINWEELPIVRNPEEDDDYINHNIPGWDDELDNYEPEEFCETYTSNIYENGIPVKVYVSKTWISHERTMITYALKSAGYKPRSVMWDGQCCYCEEGDNDYKYIGNRDELLPFVESLGELPYEHIRKTLPNKKIDLKYIL